ncbi:hypothetical protein ABZ372_22745 [Streptomyces sp. NPDC005921]|uniref:hypothetical protein n=1 Tax=Streptomyces sp. NPDC005827 TaxID=3157070 RepID=UPI0033F35543
MWSEREFRMADGAEITGRQGDNIMLGVSLPLDEDGYLGRQCPQCSLSFRMNGEDYKTLPDDTDLWCVYCGHQTHHSLFVTTQQQARMMRVAADIGTQIVNQSMGKIFGRMARGRSSRDGFSISVSVSYKEKPFYPRPLPGIDEERLARVRTCADCDTRYAVFGEHRYCPKCGRIPATAVALDALQADTARLDALNAVPAEVKAMLREQGVFTRSWVDTIENVVGVVEALASTVFKTAVTDAPARLRGKGNVFQRLDGMADLFVDAGYEDLRVLLGPAVWRRLTEAWAARHLYTHNDGVIDEKYLRTVPSSTAQPGQRLIITEGDCYHAIEDATALSRALATLTKN